jgi:hypothetical protein
MHRFNADIVFHSSTHSSFESTRKLIRLHLFSAACLTSPPGRTLWSFGARTGDSSTVVSFVGFRLIEGGRIMKVDQQ